MIDVATARTTSVARSHRAWVLALVFLMMASNYVDRSIVAILSQPIKEEFKLSDLQVGLLGGFAFALLYMAMGVPIARLAERRSRVAIISASMAVWSLMTALCGLAGAYLPLLLLRIGVGVGEAGASPPSQSLLADYFPADQRGSALAIHSLGIPVGTLGGTILGGVVGQAFGWRAAFILVGLPGLLLALLFVLTVREPQRGAQDSAAVVARTAATPVPGFLSGAATLFRRPTFTALCVGMALANLGLQGITVFKASMILRRFDVSLAEVGTVLGLVTGIGTGIGTLVGGLLSDRLARRDRRWLTWVPALGLIATGPVYAFALVQPTWKATAITLLLPGISSLLFVAPTLATVQSLAEPRMRATANALLTLCGACAGLIFGPALAGLLSDRFGERAFGLPGAFASACPGGTSPANAAAAVRMACRAASATGIQRSSLVFCGFFMLSGLVFMLAALTVRRDLDNVAEGR